MTEIHIDSATNGQLDYAVAVALGFEARITGGACVIKRGFYSIEEVYNPTADQEHGGELIDEFKICTRFENGYWSAWFLDKEKLCETDDKIRLLAACKAFLWSKFTSGMIPTKED
jgi:hypothetical protein